MDDVLIRSTSGVTLIGGAPVLEETLARALARAPRLVAADSGADRALALGRSPEMAIGDLDSLSDAGRARLGPARLHRVAEQETTDFEKCLSRIAAPFVLAPGFLEGRADHALAALAALARAPMPVVLMGGADLAFLAPLRLALDLPRRMRFSLFPLGPVGGESAGLRWPIEGLDFAPGGRVGTSNEVTGPVELRFTARAMLVLLPPEALDAVLAGLLGGEASGV